MISLLLWSCAQIRPMKEPEVSLAGIAVNSFALDKQDLRLSLNVANPNSQDIEIKHIKYLVTVNSTSLARGSHQEKVVLQANAEQVINIDVTTYLGEAVPLLKQMVFSPSIPLQYHLDLKVRISKPLPYLYKLEREGSLDIL